MFRGDTSGYTQNNSRQGPHPSSYGHFSDKIELMRACGPPLALRRLLFPGLFLLVRGIAHGEVFVLPDLVMIRDAEPDIPPPHQFPDLAATWKLAPPRYRRQYAIPIEVYLKGPESLPGNLPLVDAAAGIDALKLPKFAAPTELEPRQSGTWTASVILDIQEGVDFDAGHTFGSIGKIGAAVFAPFPEESLRPWSGEAGWARSGMLSGTAKIGMKEGGGVLPYSIASLNWDRGINQSDKYLVELHYFGYSAYRLSVLGAVDLSFRFGENNWSLITKVEGGLSHTGNDTEEGVRGVLAIGLDLPAYGLRNELGVDIVYEDSGKIRAMPFLGFNWLPDDNISVYAQAEFFMRYPESLGSAFFRKRVKAFEAQIPIQFRYRLGIAQIEKKRISYLLEVFYAEGRFCGMKDGVIVNRNDRHLLGLVSIGYDFGSEHIGFSGEMDFSLPGFTGIWESRIELTARRLSCYIFSGSQDSILAEFSGGSRREEAIIGLGLNWEIDESWRAGMSAYARVPWDRPSLKLTFAWEGAGAADE